ncbi:MAG TPA: ECF transporter S component [Firmicutes bacterium]|jgi:hypothetical protein|nr:ECF transporter S component [Candidatus Fermentithermobacillaceae bacterium]
MRLGVRRLVYTAVLAALAVAFQLGTLPQAFTGPAINANLYVSSMFVGPLSGVIVGLITPWVALMTGIMKLAPAVPVIMAGNASLALVSHYVGRWNKYAGLALAAVVKWAVMTLGIKYLISAGTTIPPAAYASLTLTQLFTALGGAVVAGIVLEALARFKHGRSYS